LVLAGPSRSLESEEKTPRLFHELICKCCLFRADVRGVRASHICCDANQGAEREPALSFRFVTTRRLSYLYTSAQDGASLHGMKNPNDR